MMESNKDEPDYTSLTMNDEHNPNRNMSRSFIYFISPSYPKKRIKCGGMCCCLLVISFCLCFFLIPRHPTVVLNKLIISENGTGYGIFKFTNNNYYDITWKDPDISLYWLPYKGQSVGNICYNQGDYCDSSVYVNSICAIKLGEFELKDHFNTKGKTKVQKDIPMMESTPQELACTTWMLMNPYQGMSQRMITYGHIIANSNLHNYGKINIPKTYYYLN